MKLHQLIEELTKLQSLHGPDVEVKCSDQNHYTENGPVTKLTLSEGWNEGDPNFILLEPE